MKLHLGLDIGTTAVKAALFDSTGEMQGCAAAEYTLETPAVDMVELDAEIYLESVHSALDAALSQAGGPLGSIRSLAITGQAETLICTDHANQPLRKAIVWLDNRAVGEAKQLEERFGLGLLCAMSGQTAMLPCWPAAKILWLRNHEPEVFARTARFMMVEDFIGARLTGSVATCKGLMPSSLYYDMRTGGYSGAMLDFLGISSARLPELREPGSPIGRWGNAVLGAAPIDHVCGLLGSGGGRDGVITATTGCTMAACAALTHLDYDPERQLGTYHGFDPDSFVFLPWAPTAGMLLRRFRDEFCRDWSYADFDRAAAEVPPGSDGLVILPHCAGAVSPQCNPAARGVAYGITLAHTRGHFARAIMESVAYLLRDNLAALAARGIPLSRLRLLGGAARSALWLQIQSDVLNLPVEVTRCEEATSLGAAILGRVAAGDFASAGAGAEAMVQVRSRVTPSERSATCYDRFFEEYRKLNQLLLPTFGGKS